MDVDNVENQRIEHVFCAMCQVDHNYFLFCRCLPWKKREELAGYGLIITRMLIFYEFIELRCG